MACKLARSSFGLFAGAVFISALAVAGAAQAQETPVSAFPKSCFIAPAKLSDAEIQGFVANPAGILEGTQSGGINLSSRVRSLAGSSSDTLDVLLSLVTTRGGNTQPEANSAQIAAIGAGLSRAARSCVDTDAEYAGLIQSKVAELDNDELISAFLSGSDEIQTAAVQGGGAGAAGAAGIGGGGEAGGGTQGTGLEELFTNTATSVSGDASGAFFASEDAGSSVESSVSETTP